MNQLDESLIMVDLKITSHNLFSKTPKTLGIMKTECELISESTLNNRTDGVKRHALFSSKRSV